jgi:hypothetical protein
VSFVRHSSLHKSFDGAVEFRRPRHCILSDRGSSVFALPQISSGSRRAAGDPPIPLPPSPAAGSMPHQAGMAGKGEIWQNEPWAWAYGPRPGFILPYRAVYVDVHIIGKFGARRRPKVAAHFLFLEYEQI